MTHTNFPFIISFKVHFVFYLYFLVWTGLQCKTGSPPFVFVGLKMDQPRLPALGAAAPCPPALAAVAMLLPKGDTEENPCAHVLCVAGMSVSWQVLAGAVSRVCSPDWQVLRCYEQSVMS